MNKKKVLVASLCFIVAVFLLFFAFNITSKPKFRKWPDLVSADVELEFFFASRDIAVIGRVVDNVDAGEPLYKDKNGRNSSEYKKFKAKIVVLMRIKGEVNEEIIAFDYFSPKYSYGFSSLSVGDLIFFAPEGDKNGYPFWLENYVSISTNGNLIDKLWYKRIDFKKGADILKFLGYRVYDKQIATNLLERFLGKPVPDEMTMTVSTDPDGWIIRGKCNKPFGWGCSEKDFCYMIFSFKGRLYKCWEYSKPMFQIND